MSEWYTIGLQAGRNVVEKVNTFIKKHHQDDTHNFDPERYKVMKDGSSIYKWYMKWDPVWFKDEKELVGILNTFNRSKDKEDAYKLICVGDEGGNDYYANSIGWDLFEDLYPSRSVIFPEDQEEKKENTWELPATIIDVIEDFLDEKNVKIENDEHEGDNGEAIIYGSDFDFLLNKITETLKNFDIPIREAWS